MMIMLMVMRKAIRMVQSRTPHLSMPITDSDLGLPLSRLVANAISTQVKAHRCARHCLRLLDSFFKMSVKRVLAVLGVIILW